MKRAAIPLLMLLAAGCSTNHSVAESWMDAPVVAAVQQWGAPYGGRPTTAQTQTENHLAAPTVFGPPTLPQGVAEYWWPASAGAVDTVHVSPGYALIPTTGTVGQDSFLVGCDRKITAIEGVVRHITIAGQCDGFARRK